jgi:hypothetical protein
VAAESVAICSTDSAGVFEIDRLPTIENSADV